jgi:hypothetical protein
MGHVSFRATRKRAHSYVPFSSAILSLSLVEGGDDLDALACYILG